MGCYTPTLTEAVCVRAWGYASQTIVPMMITHIVSDIAKAS